MPEGHDYGAAGGKDAGAIEPDQHLDKTAAGSGHVAGAPADGADALSAWWQLCNPVSALAGDAPHVYLTKDMYFSGHAATTFLLFCYWWPHPGLCWPALAAHAGVAAVVSLAHLHYTVDVVGAWVITGLAFWLARRLLPLTRFRANGVGSSLATHAAGFGRRRDSP